MSGRLVLQPETWGGKKPKNDTGVSGGIQVEESTYREENAAPWRKYWKMSARARVLSPGRGGVVERQVAESRNKWPHMPSSHLLSLLPAESDLLAFIMSHAPEPMASCNFRFCLFQHPRCLLWTLPLLGLLSSIYSICSPVILKSNVGAIPPILLTSPIPGTGQPPTVAYLLQCYVCNYALGLPQLLWNVGPATPLTFFLSWQRYLPTLVFY